MGHISNGTSPGSGRGWRTRGFYYCAAGGHYIKKEMATFKHKKPYCQEHHLQVRLGPRCSHSLARNKH